MSVRSGVFSLGSGILLLAGLSLVTRADAQPAQAAAPASAATRIGYVDMLRLIEGSPQMADLRSRLKREFGPRDDAIHADDAKLAALRQRYERDNAIMTKQDADSLKREIEATERANKRMKDEARADYNERAKVDNNRTIQLIQDAVIEVARAQGYDLVVPSPVLYASSRIDLTDAVLQRLRQLGAGSTKP